MIIETSRFGPTEVDENRLIRLEMGVLGFPNEKDYALIQTADGSGFYWLQAVTRPDLAFVVCDPRLFVPDYRAPIKTEELEQIGLGGVERPHGHAVGTDRGQVAARGRYLLKGPRQHAGPRA